MKEKLKNPVWSALKETHNDFVLEYNNAKFYKPDMCNFGGISINKDVSKSVEKYTKLCQDFYLVGDKPEVNNNLVLKNEVPCYQMILEEVVASFNTTSIIKLDASYIDEVYDLV